LVGYEESVGQGGDLILRAVANLYTFWLSNATYREQAKSLFLRHKDELISSVGRSVGAIVEPLSKTVGLEALGKVPSQNRARGSGIVDEFLDRDGVGDRFFQHRNPRITTPLACLFLDPGEPSEPK
jgi:hypothetical protein